MAKYNIRDFFRTPILAGNEPAAQRQAWEQWFTAHSIDPADVLWTGWVERRLHNENKIVYLSAVTAGGEQIHQERTQILNQPPAPFPTP